MSLIKSISGIRGTIGGVQGEGLSPIDVVKFTSAFATFLKKNSSKEKLQLVVGRDARVSGQMVDSLVVGTLMGMGIDVIETGLSTTPTVEVAVVDKKADGGIIITASHNPMQWNALKLLNAKGEFINAAEGNEVLELAETMDINFAQVENLGKYITDFNTIDTHIQNVINPSVFSDAPMHNTNNEMNNNINNQGAELIKEGVKDMPGWVKAFAGVAIFVGSLWGGYMFTDHKAKKQQETNKKKKEN